MIGKNIDNIEELGDIGPMNLDKVHPTNSSSNNKSRIDLNISLARSA